MDHHPFDPHHYVSKVKGRDYLEVKWRVAWMRSEHPDAIIETDLASHQDGRAIMRARVTLPNGASATGWGSETVSTSETYIEKAETKAIGRALTALGFGTPLNTEIEASEPARQQSPPPNQSNAFLATPAQRSRIQRASNELNLDDSALNELVRQHTGSDFATMNKRQASGIIDLLESRRPMAQQAS